MPQQPAIGADVTSLMPAVGEDVSHLMDASTQSTPAARPWHASLTDFASQLQSLNPVAIAKGIGHTLSDLPGAVDAALQQNKDLLKKAEDSFKAGDYSEGVRHSLGYLANGIPGFGHRLDEAGTDTKEGRYAQGIGKTVDAAIGVMGPKALSEMKSLKVLPAIAKNVHPAEADAAAYVASKGAPLDAAATSGNPYVAFVQKTADESALGSVVGQYKRAQTQGKLATLGEQLAAKAHPNPVTAAQAAEAADAGTLATKRASGATANDAYGRFRAAEEAAATPPTADLTAIQSAVEPLYKRMAIGADVAPLQGMKARAVQAMARLLQSPSTVGLSEAESALGDLKSMERSGVPLVGNMVDQLDRAIQRGAATLGPDAVAALHEGRAATVAKYAADDVLKVLRQGSGEPVGAFNRMARAGDAGANHLRDTLAQSPAARPLIARAVLDDIMSNPTVGPKKALTDWQQLGQRTTAMLYEPGHAAEIGKFLQAREMLARNPNPSMSGFTLLKGGELALRDLHLTLSMPVISTLMHSQVGVKLLTRGLTMPLGSRAASVAYAGQLSRVLAAEGAPGLMPAMAGDDPSQAPTAAPGLSR